MTESLPVVTNLAAAAAGPGAIRVQWSVSSLSYLVGFDVLVKDTTNGSVAKRVSLASPTREYVASGLVPTRDYAINVRCLVEVGGKQIACTAGAEVPPPPPPPTGMKVGLDSGGWYLPNDAALTAGKVKLARYQNISAEEMTQLASHGYTIIDLFGHNPATGQTPATVAAEAAARAKAHPNIVATEIDNEPENPWMGGSDTQEQIEAYARVINAVVAKYVGEGIQIPVLWSCDGGYSGVPDWGAKVWPLLSAQAKERGRPTVHPYGGHGSSSALGGRNRVEEAFHLTGHKVWVTEVGWPTAVGQEPTGDSLQWTEEQQAANIKSFLTWAPQYCECVIIFQYRDYGTNDFYGVEHKDGTHKPSFDVLQSFAS